MNKKKKEVIVVGGGLAGLSACMQLAEEGFHVKLISVTKVKRSHSVCAQGGINAALNLKDEQDSPLIHAYDTLKGGDFLADQPPVVEMCMAAPGIIKLMDRLGCPFNRTVDGSLDARRFGGTLYHRTVFCGASTGQQLLYALDEQVRRFEAKGSVEKFEHHEFLRLVVDEEGRARGIVLMDLFTLQLSLMKADAVIFATGGPGLIFKKSTNSTFCTGASNGRLFSQGVYYANGEFIQIHPTAIPGEDKLRLISESTRGEGGRIWVYGDSSKSITTNSGQVIPCGKTKEPWYFLEELYPAFGNLAPRDIASREILRVCEMGLGIDGKMQVYLDMTHLPEEKRKKVESVLDIYHKFTQEDPAKVPMRIFPAVHYSMGGCWVDWPAFEDPDRFTRFRHMTNIPGCFNIGESDFQYHGANRLGANSLLSCIFSGLVVAKEMPAYIGSLKKSYTDLPSSVFLPPLKEEEAKKEQLLRQKGQENPFVLHDELSHLMVMHMTVKRDNPHLKSTIDSLLQIQKRLKNIQLADTGTLVNQSFIFANQLGPMVNLALAMTKSALMREESRGSHYKPEVPKKSAEWQKTTIAQYKGEGVEPEIFYKPVDNRYYPFDTARDYTHAEKIKPHLENIPYGLKALL